jgi:beta-phosphoglucomutase
LISFFLGNRKLRKKTKINGYFKKKRVPQLFSRYGSKRNFTGVIPMLKYLKEKNQAIALGSASKTQDHLGETGIIHYFDVIVDGNDVSNAKPDPEVFLIAAIRCKTRRRHCFEDSVAGVQAANIGKMMSIGLMKKNTI